MEKFTHLLFLIFFLFPFNTCISQTTWLRIPGSVSSGPYLHNDSTTIGPSQLVVSPNGTIYTFIQESPEHDTWLYALDPFGQVLWNMSIAGHATTYRDDAYGLHATIDNGCIYYVEHLGSYVGDSIVRRDSTGGLVWHKEYSTNLGNPHDLVYSISQTLYNTTIVQFYDSLVEYGLSGNFIQDIVPFSRYASLSHLPDSDFIRNESPIIRRENLVGFIKWSIQMPGFQVSAANLDFVLLISNSQVVKIDASNGNIIWTKPILFTNLVPTSDLGFITTFENTLSKYNSLGTLEWSKLIQLPHFTLRGLGEIPGKSYISGGAWQTRSLWNPMFNGFYKYAPLLFSVDSMGNSILDSVNSFICGNANDNSILAFSDDAVYVAAALSSTGEAREQAIRNSFPGDILFAPEWQNRFSSGLNHKFSDLDGNGIVNLNDINVLSILQYPLFSYDHIRPHWLKQGSNSILPDLKFIFENHYINYLDTIVIDVVLGSANASIDSIYGLSFDLTIGDLYPSSSNIQSFYSIKPSALGDTSQNLFAYYYFNPNALPRSSYCVLCRTDNMNATIAGDTLVKIYYVLPSGTNYTNPISMYVNWNAINEAGLPIALNTTTDTLYLMGVNEVNSIASKKLISYPNPVNDKINITSNMKENFSIQIFDEFGNVIYKSIQEYNSAIIDVSKFANGLYFISTESRNRTLKSKFIVQH